MSLETRINEDLKTAMKAQDQVALRGIRAVKSAILLAKTDGTGNAIDEAKEVQMLQKLVKQRKESLEIFLRENRQELAQKEKEEIEIIEKYLPKMMDESEIEAAVKEVIAATGASSAKDLGKVMGVITKQLAGKADGKLIAETVKRLLN